MSRKKLTTITSEYLRISNESFAAGSGALLNRVHVIFMMNFNVDNKHPTVVQKTFSEDPYYQVLTN